MLLKLQGVRLCQYGHYLRQLSPDMMLNRLVNSCYDSYPCVFPKAFRVIDGRHYPIEEVRLHEIKNTIDNAMFDF